jgi:AraC-like DNA-binding protein
LIGGFLIENLNKIQNSVDYIEKNLCEEITLDKLARNAYLSKFHFHRLFRQEVGEAVMRYIRKRRLAEAAKEINNTSETITNIAYKYQFGSEETFSRAFKRMYGISPKEYRQSKVVIILSSKTVMQGQQSAIEMSNGSVFGLAA